MDGNGRWATRRLLPRVAGHKVGVDALRACVRHCGDRGVKVLTVFAFSSENWNRPAEEVSGLMELLAMALGREVPQLIDILTPSQPQRRGSQLSLRVKGPREAGRALFEHLGAQGIVGDWREPDVIRVAPTALYNRFEDACRLVQALKAFART